MDDQGESEDHYSTSKETADEDSTVNPSIPVGESSESNTVDTIQEKLDALSECEGWQVEGGAARVHYSGGSDRYSIEFYGPSGCTLYWKVPPADSTQDTAVPVGRNTVPDPLRERIREDLATAGIDPAVDEQTL